jgi:hypothetical protein
LTGTGELVQVRWAGLYRTAGAGTPKPAVRSVLKFQIWMDDRGWIDNLDAKHKQAGETKRLLCLMPCLDAKFSPKFHYAKRRFPITSKYRHMYGVLNVDEIKN